MTPEPYTWGEIPQTRYGWQELEREALAYERRASERRRGKEYVRTYTYGHAAEVPGQGVIYG